MWAQQSRVLADLDITPPEIPRNNWLPCMEVDKLAYKTIQVIKCSVRKCIHSAKKRGLNNQSFNRMNTHHQGSMSNLPFSGKQAKNAEGEERDELSLSLKQAL